ncbi:MAG: cytidine deaminase [bacterium]|jgi:cytidine deaminase
MKKQIGMKRLLQAALKAARISYSPYSRFPVGAALLTAAGDVCVGCNVENASYGLTLCAERVAIVKAVSGGMQKFKALAVVGGSGKAALPCGACLQVLAEFCSPDFQLILAPLDDLNKSEVFFLGDLLPHAFAMREKSE